MINPSHDIENTSYLLQHVESKLTSFQNENLQATNSKPLLRASNVIAPVQEIDDEMTIPYIQQENQETNVISNVEF